MRTRNADLARIRRIVCSSRRNERPQPGRDDKVLADWNGLAITGLAHAARVNGKLDGEERPRSRRSVSCLNRWRRATGSRIPSLDGTLVYPGVATDYANMIRAALALFALEGDAAFLKTGRDLVRRRQAASLRRSSVRLQSFRRRCAAAHRSTALALRRSDAGSDRHDGGKCRNALHADRRRLLPRARRASARPSRDRGRPRHHRRCKPSVRLRHAVRGRLAFVMGEGAEADELLAAALAEADPALFASHVRPESIRKGHPAEGKQPKGSAAMFLCDAFRCLPEIASASNAAETLKATRRGLA